MSALLLTAAAAVAASFMPPSFSPDDLQRLLMKYPQGALAYEKAGAAMIDVQVDPKGHVSHCKAVSMYGDRQLAGSICAFVDGMHIQPAMVQGHSSYGTVEQLVRFWLPGSKSGDQIGALEEASDFEVQVNLLPSGQPSLRVKANVLVDTSGKPLACVAPEAPAGYGDVACSQVSGVTFGSLQDNDGKPVQYVRSVTIDFVKSGG